MGFIPIKLLVISHAGVKRINRAVYSLLKDHVAALTVIVPSRLVLKSQAIVLPDAAVAGEADIVPMELEGTNPRKYFYPELMRWLDLHKPDIILLENDPASNLGVRLASWCNKNGSKLVCQTYDNTWRNIWDTAKQEGIRAVPKNLLIHLLNYRMARKVHALLVINSDSAEIFNQYNYPNVVQIPLGYDKSVFYPDHIKRAASRKILSVDEDTVLVAYFGRLVRQKGIHILLLALAELKHLRWQLLLDNNHDSENHYSVYIRGLINDLDLNDRVIYFDADHYEIANYMRAADIMVAPSLTTPTFKEQYGRAVQEAMACGCVCVVSGSGHLKDLVGDSDLVFREGDHARLKAILAGLMQNVGLRSEYISFLTRRASENFRIENQSQKLKETIKNLVE
jgi:glycosyltransferase involved in cell wall biosynthesis